MAFAKTGFQWLAWLFLVAVAIQFFLAGLGVLGGESIEAHRAWGYMALHLIPILMFVLALVGKLGRKPIMMTVVLFVLIFLQPLFASPDLEPMWIRSFHVLVALFIFMLGYHIAERSGMPWHSDGAS